MKCQRMILISNIAEDLIRASSINYELAASVEIVGLCTRLKTSTLDNLNEQSQILVI